MICGKQSRSFRFSSKIFLVYAINILYNFISTNYLKSIRKTIMRRSQHAIFYGSLDQQR